MSDVLEKSNGLERAIYLDAANCDIHGSTIKELESENDLLRGEISDLQDEVRRLKVELAESEEKIQDLTGHLDDIDDSLTKAVKRLR